MARQRCCKTIEGKDVCKVGEKVGEIHFGAETRVARREGDGGGKDVRHREGEELLKTL